MIEILHELQYAYMYYTTRIPMLLVTKVDISLCGFPIHSSNTSIFGYLDPLGV